MRRRRKRDRQRDSGADQIQEEQRTEEGQESEQRASRESADGRKGVRTGRHRQLWGYGHFSSEGGAEMRE